jgi:acyl-CoA reductase-like NAD-dependent aldehyde dehydrogenase
MTIQGEMIIGQRIVRGSAGTIRAFNPATQAQLEPEFGLATREDVDAACTLAEQAFDAYRSVPLEQRASFLEAIADRIMDIGPLLIERAGQESGLPAARLEGERGRTVNQLRCSPRSCATAASSAPPWIRLCPSAPRRARTCACVTSRSARSPCSAPRTSRWPSRSPAATRHRHWRPAARWWSRPTTPTSAPRNWWPRRSTRQRATAACRKACSRC